MSRLTGQSGIKVSKDSIYPSLNKEGELSHMLGSGKTHEDELACRMSKEKIIPNSKCNETDMQCTKSNGCMDIKEVEELIENKGMKVVSRIVEESGSSPMCSYIHIQDRYGFNALVYLDQNFLCSDNRPVSKYDFVAKRASSPPLKVKDMMNSGSYSDCETYAVVCRDNICVTTGQEASKDSTLTFVDSKKQAPTNTKAAALESGNCIKIYPVIEGKLLYASVDEIHAVIQDKANKIHCAVMKETMSKLEHIQDDAKCILNAAYSLTCNYMSAADELEEKFNSIYYGLGEGDCVLRPSKDLCNLANQYQDCVFSLVDKIELQDRLDKSKLDLLKAADGCCYCDGSMNYKSPC